MSNCQGQKTTFLECLEYSLAELSANPLGTCSNATFVRLQGSLEPKGGNLSKEPVEDSKYLCKSDF